MPQLSPNSGYLIFLCVIVSLFLLINFFSYKNHLIKLTTISNTMNKKMVYF
uniref:ATP synthase F0 subunit 8 n=1 Tax=Austropeplea brazieri TaxID=3113661 RepID=UPI0030017B67|nr:ATP synthase F0 subunit 8 [Austropeplea brazieri]